MKLYRDLECGNILTEEDLRKEFEELKANGETETETFDEYMHNCLYYGCSIEVYEINLVGGGLFTITCNGKYLVNIDGEICKENGINGLRDIYEYVSTHNVLDTVYVKDIENILKKSEREE